MGLVRRLLDEKPDRPLAIVKSAYNAKRVGFWKTGGGNNNGYAALIGDTKLAIEKAKAQGITLHPRALVWCQGESDARSQGASHDPVMYRETLESMIPALRKDLDAPELIALLGFNTKFGKRWSKVSSPRPGVMKIHGAQIQIAENCIYTERVEDWGCQVVNAAHFGAAGTLELGKCYAEALLQTEENLKCSKEE